MKLFKTIILLLATMAVTVNACTIFVLTDAKQTLFCNNEDWISPETRLWFVPGGEDYYGCLYVGFNNGWGQGGLNTEGLAYDWVAGYTQEWQPGPELKTARGNPSERMLESCATVEEAITFFKTYKDPSFSHARILLADKTGASAVIGAKDGKLDIQTKHQSHGFGYGEKQLHTLLPQKSTPTLSNGVALLRACKQPGRASTKYANVFNLTTGDIWLLPRPDLQAQVQLNLTEEMKKGPHYYDIPKIEQQLKQPPQPLHNNMKRFVFEQYQPIPEMDAAATEQFRQLLADATAGCMDAEDYHASLWQGLKGQQKDIQAGLLEFGALVSVKPVEYQKEKEQRRFRYILTFKHARLLMHLVFDANNKALKLDTEAVEFFGEG
ncbi:hypothetical protein ACFL6U_32470 [Planctomycetota bacterium]